MRLVFFIFSLSPGGAERVLASLANHFAANGHIVSVVTLAPLGRDFYPLNPDIQRFSLNASGRSSGGLSGGFANMRRVWRLRKILQNLSPEVVVSFMTTANILLGLASILAPWRAIGSERIHPPALPLERLWSSLRAVSYHWLDCVVAQTQASANWLCQYTKARKVCVIPNAVSWPLPDSGGVLGCASVLPTARRVLLAVGRLDKQKGFDLLMEAFAGLQLRFPEWDLVILGDGKERASLEARAGGLLNRRIYLPGHAGNMSEWYARADLFVLASRFEGFPNVLMEAMANGCAVISTDCPTGPGELIVHGENGWLVASEDGAGMARQLEMVMDDAALRRRCGQAASCVRERFAAERVFARWLALFEGGS